MRLTTSHCKNKGVQMRHTGPRNWTDNLERPWQRLGVDGRTIFRMDLEEIGTNTRNWFDSAQDMDYWRVLVNAALNLQVPKATELIFSYFFKSKGNHK